MPGRDRTGPIGLGSKTGRGLGLCTRAKSAASGGLRLRRGCGCRPDLRLTGSRRRTSRHNASAEIHKELLHEQKASLQRRLEVIDRHLERL